MKKKIVSIFLVLVLCLICGCTSDVENVASEQTESVETQIEATSSIAEESETVSSKTLSEYISDTWAAVNSVPTEEEKADTLDDMNDILQKLTTKEIDRMELNCCETIFESTDKELIKEWIGILRELKFSAIKYEGRLGGGLYLLTFYSGDEKIYAGGGYDSDDVIMENNERVMLKIDNSNDKREKFIELELKLGYDRDKWFVYYAELMDKIQQQ